MMLIPGTLHRYAAQDEGQDTRAAVYAPDPDHIWNRVYRQFYARTGQDGIAYGGGDQLDPLLWVETKYLLDGPSYQETLRLLDEFLSSHAETLISDPLKQAMFQRDLWAVFDWSVNKHGNNFKAQRRELQARLAEIMARVALSEPQIQRLPDNYALALASFPDQYNTNEPKAAFLPSTLFQPESPYVLIGSEETPPSPAGIIHTFAFSGRSAFLVFLRLQEGKQATHDYLARLHQAKNVRVAPMFPPATQLVLLRRAILIDNRGHLVASPLTESVQIRVESSHGMPGSSNAVELLDVFEFKLSRERLFAGEAGGLYAVQPDEKEFRQFMSHGVDVFEMADQLPAEHLMITLDTCAQCHSIKRGQPFFATFSFGSPYRPLYETTLADEVRMVIQWKQEQEDWAALQRLWP